MSVAIVYQKLHQISVAVLTLIGHKQTDRRENIYSDEASS